MLPTNVLPLPWTSLSSRLPVEAVAVLPLRFPSSHPGFLYFAVVSLAAAVAVVVIAGPAVEVVHSPLIYF